MIELTGRCLVGPNDLPVQYIYLLEAILDLTPNLDRRIVIGQKPVKLRIVRLSPTRAVNTNQFSEWNLDKVRLPIIKIPAINQTNLSKYQDFVFAMNIIFLL